MSVWMPVRVNAHLIRNMAQRTKYPISALPVSPPSHLLTLNLTPDARTPSVAEFRSNVVATSPSLQRRARLLDPPCHFSYVNPFPIPFPYDIEPPVPSDSEPIKDKGAYIEQWLAAREAVHEQKPFRDFPNAPLRKFYPKHRDQTLDLIGISETGLRDCVPHLDVGDAFAILGTPSLSNPFDDEGDPIPSNDENVVAARQDLIDVLSGHAVLMSPDPSAKDAFAPWSLRYSGHQFGTWAGQLGDGRAISIVVTPHPSDPDASYELQLKGSGRTPFSRSADGLAVLRSSIREYLCSEAMQALGIPTTRSLALVSLPALPVARERQETACVLTRMAPSFIRIGSFEALNSPTEMFFFGGGQQKSDWEGLRILGEWVAHRVLQLDAAEGEAWGTKLVLDVAERNARMVAAWQAYGFMHGVINTDNVSILGLTIDYGPYSFMDVFDSYHICNHTDESGRYAYRHQPSMIVYALRALLNALAPLIGAEQENGGKAVTKGWAQDASTEKINEWKKEGLELKDEVERVMQQVCSDEYRRLMRKRLTLRRTDPQDEARVCRPLLDIMETHRLDFHGTFRTLCSFKPSLLDPLQDGIPSSQEKQKGKASNESSPVLEAFIKQLLSWAPDQQLLNHGQATEDWLRWLEVYAQRITSEREEWGENMDEEREAAAKGANPRFVLRQWLLEEVIRKVERDSDSGKRVLAKVMHMACNPFEAWGAEGDERPESELDAEEKEERRYCGIGEKKMLGFQCSCSS